MEIALTIKEIPVQAVWDEETEEIQTKKPIIKDSKLVEIKKLKEKFYVTSITDLLNRYGTIELHKYIPYEKKR